jgi:hypothetical protein
LVPDQEGRFDVALELPPTSNSGLPFEAGGWHYGLVLSEVADVVWLRHDSAGRHTRAVILGFEA